MGVYTGHRNNEITYRVEICERFCIQDEKLKKTYTERSNDESIGPELRQKEQVSTLKRFDWKISTLS